MWVPVRVRVLDAGDRMRGVGCSIDPCTSSAPQFHNDFMGPPYGRAYNALQVAQVKDGRIVSTGCPENTNGFDQQYAL